ncbi:Solute carrier family 22 member 15 [Strongyloides ratti]|uniref:Solute carrier family 22 member 15 n=1 Tax=Strongyloides ratti TaxID=34506 RepID=A0A090LM44_STRRB|nr:Solute carrier family 22 member 15 [Strongyloides ratti]CEF69213.1 Solute carrier family 22 member 15 [Strongyloides ratti]
MVGYNLNRFHFLVLITWQFSIFFAVQQIFPIFLNYVPKWRCEENSTSKYKWIDMKLLSISLKESLGFDFDNKVTQKNNISFQYTPSEFNLYNDAYDKDCQIFSLCPDNSLVFKGGEFFSAALDFEWICTRDSAFITSIISMIQFFGVLCGTVFYGFLSDYFGRKPISFFILSFGIFFLIASSFLEDWKYLLICRFIIGLCNGGTMVVIFAYMNELLLSEQRMALRAFVSWGNARVVVTLLCFIFPNWRWASIACGIFALPAIIILVILLPESPTWLYNKKKFIEYRNSLKYIASLGGINGEPEINNIKKNTDVKLKTIWTNKDLRQRLLVLGFMWFTASISSYTNDLNSSNINDNFFLNQILIASFIAFSKILLGIVDLYHPNFNRRNLHHHAQIAVSICFGIVALMLAFKYNGTYIMIFNLIGTICIEWTWDACFLCAIESMPTSIRGSAVGMCSLIARLGALMSPLITYLSSIYPPSAYIILSGVGFLNLISSYKWLPDTKGIDLNEVMQTLEMIECKEKDDLIVLSQPKVSPLH